MIFIVELLNKKLMRLSFILFLFFLTSKCSIGQEFSKGKFYSKEDFVADINYMFNKIKSTHPNFEQKTPENKWLAKKNELINSCGNKIPIIDYVFKLKEFMVLLRDEHCSIDDCALYRFDCFSDIDTIFPLILHFADDRAFIKYNFSEFKLPDKAEILEINNIPINIIIDKLSEVTIHENDIYYRLNEYKENSTTCDYISNLFSYIGVNFPYHLKLKNTKTLKIDSIILKGIKRSELKSNFKNLSGTKGKVSEFSNKISSQELIEIDKNTAKLNIRTFFNILGFGYKKSKMKKLIKQAKKYKNLIIDLRDNRGGLPKFVYNTIDYLSNNNYKIRNYSFKKSFFEKFSEKYLKSQYLKSYNKHKRSIIKNKVSEIYKLSQIYPDSIIKTDSIFKDIYRGNKNKLKYNGNIYVLMGNGSFSATTMFIDEVKQLNIGLTVGGNTGGYSAVSFFDTRFNLPVSKLVFIVRTAYNSPFNNEKIFEPIQPHIYIESDAEDFINNKDSQLLFVLDLIKKGINISNYKK